MSGSAENTQVPVAGHGKASLLDSLRMIGVLGFVAMMSGFLIVLAVSATETRIASNKKNALERAVFKVLPEATSKVAFAVEDGTLRRLAEGEDAEVMVYAGFGENEVFSGVAIEAAKQGYADIVRVLYGYDPARQSIIGLTVLEGETPGLGDKIGKDADFLANFDGLDAQLNAEGTGLAHAIKTVKHGSKSNPWEIDGIAGATISSTAVGDMMNTACDEFLPILNKHLDQLKAEK